MKILKNILGVLSIVLSVAALVLFFFNFGEIVIYPDESAVRTGTELAFGSAFGGEDTKCSMHILFCFILSALTVLFSALSLKFKGSRWAAVGFSLFDAIYMLVMALSPSYEFINTMGYTNAVSSSYVGSTPLLIAIALFATFVFSAAHLLVADSVAVAESKGQLLPISKRVVKFLRDYIGELKKIVWPGPKAVVKNTLIVLGMCLVFGLFVWLIDWGLGSLIGLIIK